MNTFFDNGDGKIFPYSKLLSEFDIKYGSRENIAYLKGKIDALNSVLNWRNVEVKDHTAYFGARPLYGYAMMMQHFAEEMAGELTHPTSNDQPPKHQGLFLDDSELEDEYYPKSTSNDQQNGDIPHPPNAIERAMEEVIKIVNTLAGNDSSIEPWDVLYGLFPCIGCGSQADEADGFGNCTCGNGNKREKVARLIAQAVKEATQKLQDEIDDVYYQQSMNEES